MWDIKSETYIQFIYRYLMFNLVLSSLNYIKCKLFFNWGQNDVIERHPLLFNWLFCTSVYIFFSISTLTGFRKQCVVLSKQFWHFHDNHQIWQDLFLFCNISRGFINILNKLLPPSALYLPSRLLKPGKLQNKQPAKYYLNYPVINLRYQKDIKHTEGCKYRNRQRRNSVSISSD